MRADWARFNPIELKNASVVFHLWEDGAFDLTIRGAGLILNASNSRINLS